MPDREKVIKGMECCVTTMPDIYPHCEECPYADAEETCANMNGLHRDALALLKAQEPRVMTLEEVKESMVIEYHSGKMCDIGRAIFDSSSVDPNGVLYGIIYRVWTSRPTDEQREATPWV